MECLNCKQAVEQDFCSHCGQEATTSKMTMRELLLDFLKSIYLFESPILKTIVALFSRPGMFVREYLEGKRQGYSRPVQFILICLTLYFVVIAVFDVNLIDTQGLENVDGKKAKALLFVKHLQGHLDKIILLSTPLTALFVKWLFFKSNYRYSEHLTMILFAQGISTLTQTALLAAIAYDTRAVHANHIIKLAIYTFMFVGFYKVSGTHSFLKALLLLLMNYVSIFVLVVVGAIVFLLLS